MSRTYNEILDEMRLAFYKESGRELSCHSEAEARLKAAAGEIYAVNSYADFIMKQMFVQTAQDEYLERHAAMRDIHRKTASKAKGELTFFLSEACERDVLIPCKTVCSAAGKPQIQFETIEEAVIYAGELSAKVPAAALLSGDRFNVQPDEITVMVNPPEYVFGVTNESCFEGGTDAECDESLRERVLDSYSASSNCINSKSLRELLLSIDEVLDAGVESGGVGLFVKIRSKSGSLTDELRNKINELLGIFRQCNAKLFISNSNAEKFSVYALINVFAGSDSKSISQQAEQIIRRFCKKEKIGEYIKSSELAAIISGIEGVKSAEVNLMPSKKSIASCSWGNYLKLDGLTVECYE